MDAKLAEFWGAVEANVKAQEEFVRSGNQMLNWIAKDLRENNAAKQACYKCNSAETHRCNSCLKWACGDHATAKRCVKCVKTGNKTDLAAEIKCTDVHQVLKTCINLMAIRARTEDLTNESAGQGIAAFAMSNRWHDIC